VLTLTPLELIDHLAALIPPPRCDRYRYQGAFAPNAPLRAGATDPPSATPARDARFPARYLWVMLLVWLFESVPLVGPNCGADMRIIALITEASPVERILEYIGEPSRRRQSHPPPDHPAGTMLSGRCRTGTSSASPSPTSNLISASPGSRRLSAAGDGAAPLVARRLAAPQSSPRHPGTLNCSAREVCQPQPLGVDGPSRPR